MQSACDAAPPLPLFAGEGARGQRSWPEPIGFMESILWMDPRAFGFQNLVIGSSVSPLRSARKGAVSQ